ncbi:arsenate reductase family protein [Halocynthiibacter namhaensis]|uniref:arsenate reductase family protein n=1 Tax=Halocynthiibacter namhaensis TaxID=1290553 RepID=UPI000578EA67|nr:ArsC/Spx/MgsR family protein [Halocynthiibacter namhaensis]
MIVYGISTCALTKRAIKTLEDAGREVAFRDVRADPMSDDEWAALLLEFGDRLVDRKSSDWRALNEWLKNSDADAQLAAKPKLMTRPVIQDGDAFHLGWDDAVQAALIET